MLEQTQAVTVTLLVPSVQVAGRYGQMVVVAVVEVVVVVAGEHTRWKLPLPIPMYSAGQTSKQMPFNRYF